jgi:hypothetical protein
MSVVGRLKSTGVLQANLFDELNYSIIGVTSTGVFHSTLFDENTSLQLTSGTPMRLNNDDSCVVYDSIDELSSGSF